MLLVLHTNLDMLFYRFYQVLPSHLHLLLEGLIVSLTNSIGLQLLQQKEKVTQRWQMLLPLVVCCIPTYSCKVNPVDYAGGVGGRHMMCGLGICIQN